MWQHNKFPVFKRFYKSDRLKKRNASLKSSDFRGSPFAMEFKSYDIQIVKYFFPRLCCHLISFIFIL